MKTKIKKIKVACFDSIRVENQWIGITVIPSLGGKISSIQNLKTGREWMWTSPYLNYKSPIYGKSYIQEYDTGGFDECFPTVDACFHPSHPWDGVYIPDHGEVFSQPWETECCEINEKQEVLITLSVSGVRFPYKFKRSIVLYPNEKLLSLSYSIKNHCDFNLPFIWSSHPIMNIEPGMKILFPTQTEAKIGFAVDDYPGRSGDSFVWPEFKNPGSPPVNLGLIPDPTSKNFKPLGVKIFTKNLREGWTKLITKDGKEAFSFSFSLNEIRNVALWLNFKKWSGSCSPPYFNIAYEPTIGACDALDIAVRYHHCAASIPARGEYKWSLGIGIH